MSPIGVFCYNRPRHLKLVLEALEASMKHLGQRLPLYIFCDGAKIEGDIKVQKTRDVAKAHPHAQVILREKNYGFDNITDGISTLCQEYGKAIIIEDDVIVSPDFLPFMLAALERYEKDPKVFVISGFMYFQAQPQHPELFFLPQQFIWGWATWERAWKYYEKEPKGWQQTLANKKFKYLFDCLGSLKFSKMLEKTLTGQWNTWDIQWGFCQARAGGLTLFPSRSLVWNCGSGGGTHGNSSLDADPDLCLREGYIHGNLTREDFKKPRLSVPYKWPDNVKADKKAMRTLALCFLKERLKKEKKMTLYFQYFLNSFLAMFTQSSQNKKAKPIQIKRAPLT
jgi:hypothetical protein